MSDTLRGSRGSQPVFPKHLEDLCDECQAIFHNWNYRNQWESVLPQPQHHSLLELGESSIKGCPVCAVLLSSIEPERLQKLQLPTKTDRSIIRVRPRFYDKTAYRVSLSFKEAKLEAIVQVTISASPTTQHTLSPGKRHTVRHDDLSLVQRWLKTCCYHHRGCAGTVFSQRLPTRLVDVGNHCWGKKKFTTLGQDNFASLLLGLPAKEMSKTFLDAITLTRMLGFRYLWIDSLCIIQGNEEDWSQESSSMGSVYANSTLNLAAAAAPDGDTGLFFDKVPSKSHGCQLLLPIDDDMESTSTWDCAIYELRYRLVEFNVLYSRAWVFQERFLAPRSLIFGTDQLAWECRKFIACETFPDSFDTNASTLPRLPGKYPISSSTWATIVQAYSKGALTLDRDKLVAFSGIARLYSINQDSTYLAGLWEVELVFQLTWFTQDPQDHPFIYRAPSWSWAAINGEILFPNTFLEPNSVKPLATVVGAITMFKTDCYGEITSGRIELECFGGSFDCVAKDQDSDFMLISMGRVKRPGCPVYPDYLDIAITRDCYFTPIIEGRSKNRDTRIVCGLVLQLCGEGHYSRVACFQVGGDENIERFQSAIKRSTNHGKAFIGDAAGGDTDKYKTQIIAII